MNFQDAKFADLDDEQPCSAWEDFWLTAGTFLLGVAPVVVVLAFALS